MVIWGFSLLSKNEPCNYDLFSLTVLDLMQASREGQNIKVTPLNKFLENNVYLITGFTWIICGELPGF